MSIGSKMFMIHSSGMFSLPLSLHLLGGIFTLSITLLHSNHRIFTFRIE